MVLLNQCSCILGLGLGAEVVAGFADAHKSAIASGFPGNYHSTNVCAFYIIQVAFQTPLILMVLCLAFGLPPLLLEPL